MTIKYKMSLSLQNVDNYNNEYNCGISEIFIKYVGIIREYLTQASESITITNQEYYRYIICKGFYEYIFVYKKFKFNIS